MLNWIEDFMEHFDCDWETAAREYHATHRTERYRPKDYEEYCDMVRDGYDDETEYFTPDIDDYGY